MTLDEAIARLNDEHKHEFVLEPGQLEEWLTELKEAKRLLKLAMDDMKILYETGTDEGCIGIKFKWRYADEALKLLGDESNGI